MSSQRPPTLRELAIDGLRAALYVLAALLLSFLISLLLSGCATDDQYAMRYQGADFALDLPAARITVDLIPYPSRFDLQQACNARAPDIAGCADLGRLAVGLCTLRIFNPVRFETLGHEFAHCIVGQFHAE
jgi:hypothetical protein